LVAAMRLDITPLRRYRDYRLLVSSATISLFGSFMTMVAVPLQVKQLTGCLMARLGGVRFSIGVGWHASAGWPSSPPCCRPLFGMTAAPIPMPRPNGVGARRREVTADLSHSGRSLNR
jgi:hypothetical protein